MIAPVGISFGISSSKTINTMITLLLLLAMLVCCWLMFKSIDWFEKI